MNAIETAKSIAEKFGTTDVFVIAEKSEVRIVHENWHPLTVGEFDKARRTICVNRRAIAEKKYTESEIVAHELGHFFASEFGLDRKSEEVFACEFAAALLKSQ